MFDNIGGKIKTLSVILCIVGIIGSIIGGIIMLVKIGVIGLLLLLGGPAAILGVSLFTFGYGELIENSEKQHHILTDISTTLSFIKTNLVQHIPQNAPSSKNTTQPQQKTAPVVPPVQHTLPAQKIVTTQNNTNQNNEQEQTYLFALQMYQQRSYNIALNAFLKIRGYKDADKYIEELQR